MTNKNNLILPIGFFFFNNIQGSLQIEHIYFMWQAFKNTMSRGANAFGQTNKHLSQRNYGYGKRNYTPPDFLANKKIPSLYDRTAVESWFAQSKILQGLHRIKYQLGGDHAARVNFVLNNFTLAMKEFVNDVGIVVYDSNAIIPNNLTDMELHAVIEWKTHYSAEKILQVLTHSKNPKCIGYIDHTGAFKAFIATPYSNRDIINNTIAQQIWSPTVSLPSSAYKIHHNLSGTKITALDILKYLYKTDRKFAEAILNQYFYNLYGQDGVLYVDTLGGSHHIPGYSLHDFY